MYEFDRGLARMLREPIPKEWLMLSPNERAAVIEGLETGVAISPRGRARADLVVTLLIEFEAV